MECLYVQVLENEIIVTGMQADTLNGSRVVGIWNELSQHTVPQAFARLLHFFPQENFLTTPKTNRL